MTGATDNWITPPEILARVGGWESFDLDPATPEVMPFRTARRRYTLRDDGLFLPWFGRVWLNPPYSQPACGRFLARMAMHGCGMALLFVRSDTNVWQDCVLGEAHGLYFIRQKPRFYSPQGVRSKSGHFAPSVLCAYGTQDLDRLAALPGGQGKFVVLRLPRALFIFAASFEGANTTWRGIVEQALAGRGAVHLADLYRAIATHPRSSRNPHWRAKVRQQVQRIGVRVARGQWEAA